MKKIIHEDERIIEILEMFTNEIKTCRVSEGEAIDKAACMLTAYMAGMIKAKCIPIKIDPMPEELAEALAALPGLNQKHVPESDFGNIKERKVAG